MIITSRLPLPAVSDWSHLVTSCGLPVQATCLQAWSRQYAAARNAVPFLQLVSGSASFVLRGDHRAGQGVKLSHGNLFYQLSNFNHFITPQPGDSTLSLLPPWHIYGGRRSPASTVSTLCFFIMLWALFKLHQLGYCLLVQLSALGACCAHLVDKYIYDRQPAGRRPVL